MDTADPTRETGRSLEAELEREIGFNEATVTVSSIELKVPSPLDVVADPERISPLDIEADPVRDGGTGDTDSLLIPPRVEDAELTRVAGLTDSGSSTIG